MNSESEKSPAAPASQQPSVAAPRSLLVYLSLLLAVAALAMALGLYFFAIRKSQDEVQALQAQIQGGETELLALQSTRKSNDQRIADMAARQGVLRDELLAQAQRLALIESAVQEQEEVRHEGHRQLRLDEVELLLVIGKARLELANDRLSAIKAYRLADQVLQGLNEPNLMNLRQSLQQELDLIESMPEDPRRAADQVFDEIQALIDASGQMLGSVEAKTPSEGVLDKLLARLVQVRDRQALELMAPQDRQHVQIAATLEITLARAALERGDIPAMQTVNSRLVQLLPRLVGDPVKLDAALKQLQSLDALTLNESDPVLGSSLRQLKSVNRRRGARP